MKEIIIKVSGMVCVGCENRIQNAIKLLAGVSNVVANHDDGSVKVMASEDVTIDSLKEVIEDLGFDVIEE